MRLVSRCICAPACVALAAWPLLAFAQDAASELDLQAKRIENETNMVALAKAKYELAKAQRDIPASGFTGAVTMGEGAGTAEETLLAVRALDRLAASVKTEVAAKCTAATAGGETSIGAPATRFPAAPVPAPGLPAATVLPTVVIYLGEARPTTAAMGIFEVSIARMATAFNGLLNPPAAAGRERMFVELGSALAGGSALLGYFKSDYEIRGAKVAVADAQFGNLVADQLAGVTAAIFFADEVDVPVSKVAYDRLQAVRALADQADQKAGAIRRRIAHLPKGSDEEAARLEAEAVRYEGPVAEFRAFEAAIEAPDDHGDAPILRISRQMALAAQPNLCSVQLKVDDAAGSTYTKKNIASAIGFMPFYVSSTVSASYRIWGKDNRLRAAGALTARTPFKRLNSLQSAATAIE